MTFKRLPTAEYSGHHIWRVGRVRPAHVRATKMPPMVPTWFGACGGHLSILCRGRRRVVYISYAGPTYSTSKSFATPDGWALCGWD
jgi:hypothetical protein